MATAADPLRRTLDTQAVAPDAAGDRPYLEAMLRRLGYSEAEIQAYIGGPREDVPTTPAPARSTVADDKAAPRDIELEYTGPGLRPFRLVVGVDASELPVTATMEAGTEVFDAGPSMEEVDALVASGDFSDFDDWGEGKPQEDAAGATKSEADLLNESPEAPKEEGEAAPGPGTTGDAAPAGKPEGKEPTDFQLGEGMVEFKETPLNDAVVEPVDAQKEAEALAAEGWDVADPGTGEFADDGAPPAEAQDAWAQPEPLQADEAAEPQAWQDPDPQWATEGQDTLAEQAAAPAPMEFDEQSWDSPQGFEHNDWRLYSRDELRGDTPQRIYFFSKDEPDGGTPAEVPEGYEVAENPETGRPFLRRAQGDVPPGPVDIDNVGGGSDPAGAGPATQKKRVRILRVRAASREDAAKKLEAEGRNVLASMPIDIEKRLGDDQ